MQETEVKKTVPLGCMVTIVGTMGSCMYLGLVFVVTQYSYRLNAIFGLCCSLLLAFCGLILIAFGYQVIRESYATANPDRKPFLVPFLEQISKGSFTRNAEQVRQFEISAFLPIVTFFLTSSTSLAFGIAKLNPAAYDHLDELSFWLMFRHYLWQLVDMVPLVDAWKHVHVEDPILENNLWPGALVLMFRLIILYLVISTAAKLFGFEKRPKAEE